MVWLIIRVLALVALTLLLAAGPALAQDPQPTVISGQYQAPVEFADFTDATTAAATTGGALAPDVSENPADNNGDTTAAPPPAPTVHVEVGDNATNVAVTVRVGSDGRDGDVTQVTGARSAPRVAIPPPPEIPEVPAVPQVTPPVPPVAVPAPAGDQERATRARRSGSRARTKAKRSAAKKPVSSTAHVAVAASTAVTQSTYERLVAAPARQPAARPARKVERDRAGRAGRPRPRADAAPPVVQPPWWTSSGTASGASGASGSGTGLALLVTALALLAFTLIRGLLTVADGPPADPPLSRLERPG